MDLETLLSRRRLIRVIGFDDAPFQRQQAEPVPIAGVVCAGTRFEGMLWGEIAPDGWNATEVIAAMLLRSKFLAQLHLILLDGISMGGFNIIDLPALSERLELPCVSVMRHLPNFSKIQVALQRLPDPEARLATMRQAGPIHQHPPFYFQVCGAEPALMARVLERLSDRGHVPEALRIAHLIASAVVKGESGRQA
jgi:uncharacterized protein